MICTFYTSDSAPRLLHELESHGFAKFENALGFLHGEEDKPLYKLRDFCDAWLWQGISTQEKARRKRTTWKLFDLPDAGCSCSTRGSNTIMHNGRGRLVYFRHASRRICRSGCDLSLVDRNWKSAGCGGHGIVFTFARDRRRAAVVFLALYAIRCQAPTLGASR